MKLPPFRKIFLVSMLIGIYSESSIASGLNFNTQSPIQDCFTNEIVSSELSNLYKSPASFGGKKKDRGNDFVQRRKIQISIDLLYSKQESLGGRAYETSSGLEPSSIHVRRTEFLL